MEDPATGCDRDLRRAPHRVPSTRHASLPPSPELRRDSSSVSTRPGTSAAREAAGSFVRRRRAESPPPRSGSEIPASPRVRVTALTAVSAPSTCYSRSLSTLSLAQRKTCQDGGGHGGKPCIHQNILRGCLSKTRETPAQALSAHRPSNLSRNSHGAEPADPEDSSLDRVSLELLEVRAEQKAMPARTST